MSHSDFLLLCMFRSVYCTAATVCQPNCSQIIIIIIINSGNSGRNTRKCLSKGKMSPNGSSGRNTNILQKNQVIQHVSKIDTVSWDGMSYCVMGWHVILCHGMTCHTWLWDGMSYLVMG
jgi:hypothetical protein